VWLRDAATRAISKAFSANRLTRARKSRVLTHFFRRLETSRKSACFGD
jgi:hypothetical protein